MPQGTIKSYDEQARSGILLDDGRNELVFDAESFRTSGVRLFRIGQRVKFALSGEPPHQRVRELTIITL
jgi:cold shock CspA family protein